MTDNFNALPSRRAQREAREAGERLSRESSGVRQTDVSDRPADEFPSRRSRRLPSSELPSSELPSSELPSGGLPSGGLPSGGLPSNGLPHDHGHDDIGDEWITASSTVGQSSLPVTSLHVELFPTGEISGPIDNTGEIILTGPIVVAAASHNRSSPIAIDASPQVGLPGIPRRATEALSIIGRAAPLNQGQKIPSARQGISAAFATFLGLFVAALIGLAFFTGLI
ncbi:MAG: hypothetical protein JHC62_01350 [Microbacteriaceae bacterium]|nr:hypothetical protein [Microbacteriaceae bacterium]